MTINSKKSRDLAPAVTRAISILETLAQANKPLTLGELVAYLDLPKSSVFGICSSLVRGSLLERGDTGAYSIGLRIVDFANSRLEQSNLTAEFMRFWDAYPYFLRDAAVLSERLERDVVYLACRNSSRPLGVAFKVGMRLPAAVTATGKAMLSTLSNREIDELYQGKGSLSDLTSQSVKSLTSLHKQLAQIRKQGYAIDDGETREGMCSFGAPVFARGRNVAVAGVALSFFRADLDKAIRNQAIATLKELAATLSEKAVSLNPSRSS